MIFPSVKTMKFVNTYNDIISVFSGETFNLQLWEKYVSLISKELVTKCTDDAKDYDFQNSVYPVVTDVLRNREKLATINHSFKVVTDNLGQSVSVLFDKEPDFDIILYLGLCNGAGWATTLDGKDVVLLGVEKIAELNWCDISSMQTLIYNETGHIWHKTYGNLYFPVNSKGEKSLLQLYQEGVAMVCEQMLCGDENFFHQNINGWLDWCCENENDIKKEFLKRINANESTQDFFGDWCSYKDHSDVGYFLGCRFVRYMMKNHSLTEVANLSCEELSNQFESYCK